MSTVMISALFLLQLLFPFATPTIPQSQPIYGPAFPLDVAPTRPVMVQGGSTAVNVFTRSDKAASFPVRIEGVPSSVTADIPQVGPGASTIVLHSLPGTPTGTYA